MQVYQNLTIKGQEANIAAFLSELEANPCGWEPNPDILKQGGLGADYKAFNVPLSVISRPARLFLHVNAARTVCSLANIIPNGGQLTPEEYNTIVQAFYAECVRSKAVTTGLDTELSQPEVFLGDTLSPRNLALLENFTSGANPETGASRPMDYRRWLTFISASALDNQLLDVELLRDYLKEKGFPGDIASDLTTQYQFGVDLIRQVNDSRQEQHRIHASS